MAKKKTSSRQNKLATKPVKAVSKRSIGEETNPKPAPSNSTGKLRIGDDWNAIRIIALSQSNPLKAIAEFVENSIDAKARHVTITRFRQRGAVYISIDDDGTGVPQNSDGAPDFRYVATHICDSLKRQLKSQGQSGIQGEFGIGLLSFWTVGDTLSMTSMGNDNRQYEMHMASGNPEYKITSRRMLATKPGTKLTIGPLLPGVRNMSGEKIQWFLASELRDRIRNGNVEVRIIDRMARLELAVEPREFEGQLMRHLPAVKTAFGEAYVEIYLGQPSPDRFVGLSKSGTRVIERLTNLDVFQKSPWNSGYFVGLIDAPFLNLTPGSRLGVILDERFQTFVESLAEVETALDQIIEQQQQIATEQASKDTFKSLQKAFREALLILPEEEYDWFDIYGMGGNQLPKRPGSSTKLVAAGSQRVAESNPAEEAANDTGWTADDAPAIDSPEPEQDGGVEIQPSFFDHAGPLFGARIAPTTCTMRVETAKTFQAVPRDRNRRLVEDDLHFEWRIAEGNATLDFSDRSTVTLTAPTDPQLIKLDLVVTQSGNTITEECPDGRIVVSAQAIITVTESMMPDKSDSGAKRGLPEYTFDKQPGQLWRSRFDSAANVIFINSGHRDFVYAARNKSLKLRYICRLFGKELILHNFPGLTQDQMLERMIELSMYTEENLR